MTAELLRDRLGAAGLPPVDVRLSDEGLAAVSGFAALADGREVFAKTFAAPPGEDASPTRPRGSTRSGPPGS